MFLYVIWNVYSCIRVNFKLYRNVKHRIVVSNKFKMASNGDISAHSSNFRWLFRKSHSADKVSEESFSKSNVLPGFKHNFLSVDMTSPNCVVVRNDIKRSVSAESESISSSSRQSSLDLHSTSPGDGLNGSEVFGLAGSSSSPCRSVPTIPSGPKFKLIHEGDIQLCRLNHCRTVINKILSSKFLRRWENHHLFLSTTQINSKTVSSFRFYSFILVSNVLFQGRKA